MGGGQGMCFRGNRKKEYHYHPLRGGARRGASCCLSFEEKKKKGKGKGGVNSFGGGALNQGREFRKKGSSFDFRRRKKTEDEGLYPHLWRKREKKGPKRAIMKQERRKVDGLLRKIGISRTEDCQGPAILDPGNSKARRP